MRDESRNLRPEFPLDIEIASNIIYTIISIPNYSSFWGFKFILFEYRRDSQEISCNTRRVEQASSKVILMALFPVQSSKLFESHDPKGASCLFFEPYIPCLTSPLLTRPLVSHQSLQKSFINFSTQRLPYLRCPVKVIRRQ